MEKRVFSWARTCIYFNITDIENIGIGLNMLSPNDVAQMAAHNGDLVLIDKMNEMGFVDFEEISRTFAKCGDRVALLWLMRKGIAPRAEIPKLIARSGNYLAAYWLNNLSYEERNYYAEIMYYHAMKNSQIKIVVTLLKNEFVTECPYKWPHVFEHYKTAVDKLKSDGVLFVLRKNIFTKQKVCIFRITRGRKMPKEELVLNDKHDVVISKLGELNIGELNIGDKDKFIIRINAMKDKLKCP